MKLETLCPFCKKPAEVKSKERYDLLKSDFVTYLCGHAQFVPVLEAVDHSFDSIVCTKCDFKESVDIHHNESLPQYHKFCPMRAYDFQEVGIDFFEKANYSALNADDMGSGKTIQSLLAYRNNKDALSPVIIVTKSAVVYQWGKEYFNWVDTNSTLYPILSSNAFIPKGFNAYVISMDTLGRNGTYKKLVDLKPKLVIVDEVHLFKDPSAKRTVALMNLIKEADINYKMALSGTPIKNRASEYFTALNMIAPSEFPSLIRFKRQWLDYDYDKKQYTRIKPYLLESFQKKIAPFVIRREKKDILKDLPDLQKNYQYATIEDPLIKESYNREIDLMENFRQNNRVEATDLLGWLAKMRRITGEGKIPFVFDQVSEFLENTEEKIAIGTQHNVVRDMLYAKFSNYSPLKLSGEDNSTAKFNIQTQFNEDESKRLLIINMRAGGTGLNLQRCPNCVVMEWDFSPADIDQFISRFHRNGQKQKVIADYIIAVGTIDEWMHDLVKQKELIFGETMGNWSLTSDSSALNDLFEKTLANKL